jgi:hypothetical protein
MDTLQKAMLPDCNSKTAPAGRNPGKADANDREGNKLPAQRLSTKPEDLPFFYFFDEDGDVVMMEAATTRALRRKVHELIHAEPADIAENANISFPEPMDIDDKFSNGSTEEKIEIPVEVPASMVKLLEKQEGDIRIIIKKGDRFLGFVEIVQRTSLKNT